ncbi:MAG: hypothetical protein ACP5VF_06490 [Acidobacteriota bacterium]
MANGEQELVVIGSRFSAQRMIEQGGVSVAVARAHAKELADKFPPAKVDELEKLLEEIRAAFGTQADAKTAFSTGNVPVNQRIDEAKRWISEVMSAADNAFEEEPEIGDPFHKAGKLGRRIPSPRAPPGLPGVSHGMTGERCARNGRPCSSAPPHLCPTSCPSTNRRRRRGRGRWRCSR